MLQNETAHASTITGIQVAPNLGCVFASSYGKIIAHDLETLKPIYEVTQPASVTCLALSIDEKYLAAGTQESYFFVCNVSNGKKPIPVQVSGFQEKITHLAFNSTSSFMLLHYLGILGVVDVFSKENPFQGQLQLVPFVHDGIVTASDMHGQYVLSGCKHGHVYFNSLLSIPDAEPTPLLKQNSTISAVKLVSTSSSLTIGLVGTSDGECMLVYIH